MTRVLIASAAYGGINIGDDAILAAMVEQLRDVKPDIEITAVTRQPDEMAERLGIRTLEFSGLLNRLRTYAEIKQTDVLIAGGGTLIAEYTRGLKGLITGHPGYPITMIWVAKLLGKKAMVYGAGVEDIKFWPTRFCVRHGLNRADVISLRDEDSRTRLVESLGVDRARVVTTADPVLAMRLPSHEEMRDLAGVSGIDIDGSPLVVINFAYGIDKRELLLDFFSKMADHVVNELGARVLFIPMNVARETDRAGMELVLSRMEYAKNADILRLPYAHPEVISIVEGAELVISSRMHLLIFAALVGTPIFGISRVPKVDAFLDHFGLSAGASTKELDFEQFRVILEQTWTARTQIREALTKKRLFLRDRALSTAKLFHDLAAASS